MRDVTICFVGNFSVDYSSESHEAASFEALGHKVIRIQEGETRAVDIAKIVAASNADLFFHVQTYGLAVTGGTEDERRQMLGDIKALSIPTAAYHLDLWRGLGREEGLADPYFQVDYFFSTDGGDKELWERYGINHYYLPPGVFHEEAFDGKPRREYTSDIAFVGSANYGHKEHAPVRTEMLHTLKRRYRNRFRLWPQGKAVRGTDLTDLYASVKIVVGDSCLAGKIDSYWSDRVAETTGRGGFLIHPYVRGILDVHPSLVTYPAGDWPALIERIDHFLAHPVERESLRVDNATYTRRHNTYLNRCQTILETIGLA